MWFALKALFVGVAKRILQALIPWLKTEAAEFVAEYFDDAKDVVARISQEDIPNDDKFKEAKLELLELLVQRGEDTRERYIHQLIEIAYESVKAEAEAEA